MHIDRLERMASLLDQHAYTMKAKFDLRTWGESTTALKACSLDDCGTFACAIGLALLTREFEPEGFRNTYPHQVAAIAPEMGDNLGFDAVEKLFGIDHVQVADLFALEPNWGSHNGPEAALHVARNIRHLIETGKTLQQSTVAVFVEEPVATKVRELEPA